MKTKNTILVAIAIIGIGFTSCYKHNWETLHPRGNASATPCVMPDTVSYNNHVLPILNASCGISGSQGPSCHASGAGPDLSNYANFSSFTSPDSLNSVYNDITWNASGNKMPLGGSKLSQCEIDKIIRWMDQGSLNN